MNIRHRGVDGGVDGVVEAGGGVKEIKQGKCKNSNGRMDGGEWNMRREKGVEKRKGGVRLRVMGC